MKVVNELVSAVTMPDMVMIEQDLGGEDCENYRNILVEKLQCEHISGRLRPGMTVAVTAGSRGISHIAEITRTVLDFLKMVGTKPFLVTAMGSHGGATVTGQLDVLAGIGITEESMGVPIRAGVEVISVGTLPDGTDVVIDKSAMEADGIVLINRIKPHTAFQSRYESGLLKMMAVGLGNQKGADYIHSGGPVQIPHRIEEISKVQMEKANVLFGVAILENAREHLSQIHVLGAEEIVQQEKELLRQARGMLPLIPFENIDVLVVDRIGKDISGGGMDPNVVGGLYRSDGGITPRPERIVVLDLTEQTHGAAFGIGAADITTRQLFEHIDFRTTYPNGLTTGALEQIKIPVIMDNHCLAIQAAIKTLLHGDRQTPRVVRIQDTLHLERMWISVSLLEDALSNSSVTIVGKPEKWKFDEKGRLF